MKKSYILFDLDGTIIEPSQGIFQSINYAMKKMNRPELSLSVLKTFIGPPLEDSFRSLGMTAEEAKDAIFYYREFYQETGIHLFTVYEEIEMVLKTLSQEKQIYLATSKPEVFAEIILKKLNFHQYFSGIYGANLEGTRSHKADVIRYVMEQATISAVDQVVMIGDRKHDVEAAKAHSVDSVGVLWGYGNQEELENEGATYIAVNANELRQLLIG